MRRRRISPSARRRGQGERGSATIETIAMFSLALAALSVLVQVVALALAHLAAQNAADQALQATRVRGGTVAAGRARAATVLDTIGAKLVTDRHISVTRNATSATVTIRGTVAAVLPGLHLPVTVTVSAPVETLR